MDDDDDAAVLGQDIVLREKDVLTDLLYQLPHKAQLGFSGLKDKFANRGDKGLKRIIAAAKTNESLKVEYTCIDVTEQTIILGSNLGIVFLYERKLKKLSRFICESKQVPIVSIKLLEDRRFIATGQFSGAITIFHYGEERNGIMKALLKCTVESHHVVPVTSVLWTTDAMKLFTADSEGNVAITVINMDEGKTHTVFICKEDSPVTQLSFSHTGLLISTLKRTLIWPFNTKKTVQVGMQDRKVFGNFGACFYPAASTLPTDEPVDVYAARPGLRLWKATTEGKVVSTMMFKDSISKGEPIIETLDLSPHMEIPHRNEAKQFGSLLVFNNQYIVTWQGSCVWVIDPNTGYVIGCHSNLGCIVDVGTSDNELFVLSKGDDHFLRKITFETVVPCIVVEELDLNNPQEIEKAIQGSSVNRFEDQDHIDKLKDEVMSKVKRGFFDVKTRVKEIKEQIRSREVSEDDRVSDASPKTIYKNNGKNDGVCEAILSGEALSTSEFDGTTSDENIQSDGKPFESSNELTEEQSNTELDTIEVEITHKKREKELPFQHLSQEAFPDSIVFEGTSIGSSPKRRKKKVKRGKNIEPVKSDSIETGVPAQTLPDTAEPAQSAPASITEDDGDTNTLCAFEDGTNEEKPPILENQTNSFKRVNSIVMKEVSFDDDINDTIKNVDPVNLHQTIIHSEVNGSVQCDRRGEEVEKLSNGTIEQECISNNAFESANHVLAQKTDISSEEVDESKVDIKNNQSQLVEITSSISDVTNIIHDVGQSSVDHEKVGDEILTDNSYSCHDDLKTNAENCLQNEKNEKMNLSDNSTENSHPSSSESLSKKCKKLDINTSELSNEMSHDKIVVMNSSIQIKQGPIENGEHDTSDELPSGEEESQHKTCTQEVNEITDKINVENKSICEDANIIHVKISHQRQGSNVSVQSLGERAKEVRGEAIERTHTRQASIPRLLGADDTLESNIHQYDEEISSINPTFEENEDDGKLYPVSPFPAPQVQSIYPLNRVSLSDFSLSDFDDKTEEEKLHDAIGEYDSIDVKNDLIESVESVADVEDNDSDSAGSNSNEPRRRTHATKTKRRSKNRHSYGNSPCSSDMESRPVHSTRAVSEIVQERLRYLADSWADVNLPSCGQIQSIACSKSVLWALDNHGHIFCSGTSSQSYNWKKQDGRAMQVACNQAGSVVWCVDRNKMAYVRNGIKESAPQGTNWESVEQNVHYVTVDDDCVWAIKTNGDIYVRTGVSKEKPCGTSWTVVREASDLVQITCFDGLVWALDVYNHVQIFKGDLNSIDETDQVSQWCELPGMTAIHVMLSSNGVCWIIDRDHGVWFNQDVSKDDPLCGTWYQLSLGEHQSQDAGWFSSVLSYFTQGNEPKMIISNEMSGVFILGKQGFLHVAHGHLLGTRWETMIPSSQSEGTCWTCVSSGGSDMNKGYIWALQPNGQLICFVPGGIYYKVQPPTRVVLKYCSAGPRSLWALTAGVDVYIRLGISDSCPQGLKWLKVDMLAQGNKRLLNICCGNRVVWAVDYEGNAWFQLSGEERRGRGFSPAWVSVEGCPLDGSQFKKIVVGPDDRIVWACDDKNNVYARKDVTDNFWVGTSWEVVAGTSGKDISISNNHVWGLCTDGDVMCRFGVSPSNVMGDYWKKVPGCFEQISVSPNDELCGIDRHGQLYQRQTLLFYGSTMSRKAPSYDELFSDHNDWEFI